MYSYAYSICWHFLEYIHLTIDLFLPFTIFFSYIFPTCFCIVFSFMWNFTTFRVFQLHTLHLGNLVLIYRRYCFNKWKNWESTSLESPPYVPLGFFPFPWMDCVTFQGKIFNIVITNFCWNYIYLTLITWRTYSFIHHMDIKFISKELLIFLIGLVQKLTTWEWEWFKDNP